MPKLGYPQQTGAVPNSAELKGPGNLLRIWPEIVDVGPQLVPNETKPIQKCPGRCPQIGTNRFRSISGCFNPDPKLLNCEKAQPR